MGLIMITFTGCSDPVLLLFAEKQHVEEFSFLPCHIELAARILRSSHLCVKPVMYLQLVSLSRAASHQHFVILCSHLKQART